MPCPKPMRGGADFNGSKADTMAVNGWAIVPRAPAPALVGLFLRCF